MCKPAPFLVALVSVAVVCTSFCNGEPGSADFNVDGRIDAADLARWEESFSIESTVAAEQADANLDGDTDGSDFLAWQREATGIPLRAPEPATIALAVPFVLFMIGRRNRKVLEYRIDQAHATLKPSQRLVRFFANKNRSTHTRSTDDCEQSELPA